MGVFWCRLKPSVIPLEVLKCLDFFISTMNLCIFLCIVIIFEWQIIGAYIVEDTTTINTTTRKSTTNTKSGSCSFCNQCVSCSRDIQKEERLNDAAREGELETVKELIKTTFVDTTEGSPTRFDGSSYGWTPLLYAARNGHKDIVQILLDNGAKIDHQSNYGDTALYWAAHYGGKDVVQLLLDRGANTKLKNIFGHTACKWNEKVDNIIQSCD